jgi:hypothetical protein
MNQKLLAALFGEAAMVEMIDRARRNLAAAITETFAEEVARFEALVPDGSELRELAHALREAAATSRALAPDVAMDQRGPTRADDPAGRWPDLPLEPVPDGSREGNWGTRGPGSGFGGRYEADDTR